jgi:hypothetical protein
MGRPPSGHYMAPISGNLLVTSGGQIMKRMTSARLFVGPKRTYKAKTRIERAKLVVAAVRERAAEVAQQPPTKPHPP